MLPPGWFYPFVAIFVVVMTVALLMQFAMLGGMFFAIKKLQNMAEGLIRDEVRPILDEVRPIINESKPTIREVRAEIAHITATVHDLEQSFRTHLREYDPLISDVAERARVQVARADDMVTHLMDRTEQVGESVEDAIGRAGDRMQRAVTTPVKRTRAVKNGLKAGFSRLLHSNGARDRDMQNNAGAEESRLASTPIVPIAEEREIIITSETFPEPPRNINPRDIDDEGGDIRRVA